MIGQFKSSPCYSIAFQIFNSVPPEPDITSIFDRRWHLNPKSHNLKTKRLETALLSPKLRCAAPLRAMGYAPFARGGYAPPVGIWRHILWRELPKVWLINHRLIHRGSNEPGVSYMNVLRLILESVINRNT